MNELFFGTHKARSTKPEEMNDIERKHTPVIELKELDQDLYEVKVEVGKWLQHPMEQGHFIEWIEVYVNSTLIARVELTPEVSRPNLRLILKLEPDYEIFAKERCNLHGTWISEIHRT